MKTANKSLISHISSTAWAAWADGAWAADLPRSKNTESDEWSYHLWGQINFPRHSENLALELWSVNLCKARFSSQHRQSSC